MLSFCGHVPIFGQLSKILHYFFLPRYDGILSSSFVSSVVRRPPRFLILSLLLDVSSNIFPILLLHRLLHLKKIIASVSDDKIEFKWPIQIKSRIYTRRFCRSIFETRQAKQTQAKSRLNAMTSPIMFTDFGPIWVGFCLKFWRICVGRQNRRV